MLTGTLPRDQLRRRLLRCGISDGPMTAWGHSRPDRNSCKSSHVRSAPIATEMV